MDKTGCVWIAATKHSPYLLASPKRESFSSTHFSSLNHTRSGLHKVTCRLISSGTPTATPKQATNVAFLGEGSGGGVAMLKGNAMPAGVQVRQGVLRVKTQGGA